MARILVVEDDEQARDTFRLMLEKAGYEVDVAADGAQGLAAFKQAPAHVVVTDIWMPEKDGVEFIRELKRNYPDARVIAITGVRGPQNRLPAASYLGAQRTLVKPFSMHDLLAAVRELLGDA